MPKHLSQDIIINRFIAIHGNFYDYSKVKFEKSTIEVVITCPLHGDFLQKPVKHFNGQGCAICGTLRRSKEKNEKARVNFIHEANKIHNNYYDYSKSQYDKAILPIIITCPKHGDFDQTPHSHLHGSGCKKCGREKTRKARLKTFDYFLSQAKKTHNDFYDYSKANYINRTTKITIICPIHGDFDQTPDSHISNATGCPTCGKEKVLNALTKTQDQFIFEAKEKHNDFFDYSKVIYKNSNKKITIICPIHGDFDQTPQSHLSGKGCAKCKKVYKKDTEYFIKDAKTIWNNEYDYSKVDYKSALSKVTITCRKHGDFEKTPAKHLFGQGCPRCAIESVKQRLTKDLDFFFKRSYAAHGDFYDYSKVNYIKAIIPVTIICPEHGDFDQTPIGHWSGKRCPKCAGNYSPTHEEFVESLNGRNILVLTKYQRNGAILDFKCGCCNHIWSTTANSVLNSGTGCPKCAEYGYQYDKPGSLYFLIDETHSYIKIGIANNVDRRMKDFDSKKQKKLRGFDFNLLTFIHDEDGYKIYELEQYAHNELFNHLNAGFSGFSGATEWFKYDASIINWMHSLVEKQKQEKEDGLAA